MRPEFCTNAPVGRPQGFTLIEAVMVIAITGAIAAMVAVFIRAPVQGYFEASQRAALTDVADTTVRRMARDLHLALPNSVRISGDTLPGNTLALEFLSTREGGRYRAEPSSLGAGNILDFTQNDTSFDILGPAITFAAGDQIVVYNLGIAGADAYAGNNRRAYGGATGAQSTVQMTAPAAPFPFDSPGHRFQVVDTPVSYVCDLGAGTLRRYSAYAISPAQVNPPAGAGVVNALLAQNVSACAFDYSPGATQRSGLVSIQLAQTVNGETVSLYQGVHVNNVP
ncbi:prepilin-type N-terminal cleavage/methylation domain-containing protein [Janthinobacterium sp. 17J80-10]|uniref:prepilin-type N-terminal cleavage/methylation domain-containing protein n=1 Tax=Janthinobacterium sp. 17J80-10 TaxID=2497863 RepID=UPI0010059EBE|nr:prepilin-type N-terminal cleavage/methylation domain-containing protein [Janthinobacterium sp. 17J80-10]QAU34276.1 prepilin-type N-terminal cleavage/methylation domain-containing protein [Janthinobacterium sp. 17J80-10]